MSEREEHREGLWCAELRCKRCYGADTWMQSEIPALRARVARLEGALRGVIAHTGYLPWADRELLAGLLASVDRIARAALAPDAARKEGV